MNKELQDILQEIIILIAQLSKGYDNKYIQEQAIILSTRISKLEVKDE